MWLILASEILSRDSPCISMCERNLRNYIGEKYGKKKNETNAQLKAGAGFYAKNIVVH